MNHSVYLALGTNLGSREENLRIAVNGISPEVNVIYRSPIYETPPWGYLEQPYFLNQVISGKTQLTPLALLRHVKELETKMGRSAGIRYGPRLIDIDILFYNDQILKTNGLEIPHPRLHDRAFVLVPLLDIAPDLLHPLLGKTISELIKQVDTSAIKLYQLG
jgi:2-amino-4-hydroxy-6-hydroxymethyldihydropteridine diphosphokinase